MSAVERARDEMDGSPGGLEQVYLVHRPALLRFLRARGAGDDAEDLLQEMWIKASAGASGPIRDPVPYLYRAANNLMLDRRRATQRQARRDADWSGAEPGIEPADDRPDAEQSALARDELEAAQEALAQLGDRTDTIFRRFRLKGDSQREIASDLGISLSAVEKHLQKAYRALVDLRRRLDAG
ncbi:RNA polymerase sigma factor [Allosphingosinicella deserti]|nr:sigma-70 family RNA polymerase sigma factor [Sphingomonas deserti]